MKLQNSGQGHYNALQSSGPTLFMQTSGREGLLRYKVVTAAVYCGALEPPKRSLTRSAVTGGVDQVGLFCSTNSRTSPVHARRLTSHLLIATSPGGAFGSLERYVNGWIALRGSFKQLLLGESSMRTMFDVLALGHCAKNLERGFRKMGFSGFKGSRCWEHSQRSWPNSRSDLIMTWVSV